jgi:hypothetical protein
MINSNPFWPRHAFLFKGGAQAIQSAPVPLPAPPVTASSAEVIQAQQDFAQQNLMKKSVKKTIYAGDTGGFTPGMAGSPGQPGPAPQTFRKLG